IDKGGAVLMVVIMVVVTVAVPPAEPSGPMGMAVGMLMGQQAVLPVLLAVSDAELNTITHPAQAHSRRVGLLQSPPLPGRAARYGIRTGLRLVASQTQGKLPGTGGAAESASALIRHAVPTQFPLRFHAAFRHAGRHAAVDQVDHPSNRTAAIHQRGRT